MADQLIIRGAREHNLKDVSLDLPRDALIVFTGLSGSGKSSLAFDTIFAEGQRRYVESLSAYARQFLGQMDKPDVDFIEGLSPAVSIDQKSTSKNPRSTVGTITEVYDYLRLLYARAGRPHCPVCGAPDRAPDPPADRRQDPHPRGGCPLPGPGPGHPRPQGRVRRAVPAAPDRRLQPRPRQRRDPPAGGAAQARQAEEAHHRGGRRPARGQGLEQAPAHRLGRDRAAAGQRPGGLRLRRPRRQGPGPRDAVLRADGLPQRAHHRHRRARAAVVLLQLAVRRLPAVPRPRHPDGGRPRAGRPRLPRHPRRGRHPAVEQRARRRLLPAPDERPRRGARLRPQHPVGRAGRQEPAPRSSTATRPRSTWSPRTATAASGPTTPPSRASAPTSSAGTPRPSPTPAGSASRASCARCPARRAGAAGSSPSPCRSPSARATRAARTSPRSARCRSTRPPPTSATVELSQREKQIAERVLKEIQERLNFLLDVGLDYLSLDRPSGLAVRRRGPAHPARHPDRCRPGRRPLRPRRAVHRPAPARQPAPHRDAGAAQGARQHPDRRRARRGHHPHRRLGRRHRPRRRRARRPGRPQRHGQGPLRAPRLDDRAVPLRPPRDPGPRGTPPAHQGSRAHRARRQGAQPAQRRRELPARRLLRGHRRLRLGQVDPGQRHPLHVAGQADLQRPHGPRPAHPDQRHRARRQGHPRRPVADRPHPAVQPRDVHRGLRPRPQALRVDARGQDARLPPGPVLVQRQGRALRGVLRRRHDQDRDELPAGRLRPVRGLPRRPLQPRDARGALQGQDHRRGPRHADRGGRWTSSPPSRRSRDT